MKKGQFIAGRFILGFGVSILLNAAPAYIAEIAPPQWRGRLTGFYNIGWVVYFLCQGQFQASIQLVWGFDSGRGYNSRNPEHSIRPLMETSSYISVLPMFACYVYRMASP